MSAERKPDKADPHSMAAYWFTYQRAGGTSADEIRAFEVWLGEAAAHKAAYDELERMWTLVGGVEEDPSILDMRDCDERVAAAHGRMRAFGVFVATALVCVGGGWALRNAGLLPQLAWLEPPPAQEFRTTTGQRATVTLADQSVVMLDTDTVLRARLSGGKRLVELERGQAFFKVAKDASRPFIVKAAGKVVRATGTAFDVRSESGRFEVTLIEGRVRVQEEGQEHADAPMANMRPGWRLAVGADTRWRMEPVDLKKVTSWHDGTLSFYYLPLATAAAEMNRYSARKIVFHGPPPDTVVIGDFRAGDVENFVRAIELYKLARVISEDEDRIELAAR